MPRDPAVSEVQHESARVHRQLYGVQGEVADRQQSWTHLTICRHIRSPPGSRRGRATAQSAVVYQVRAEAQAAARVGNVIEKRKLVRHASTPALIAVSASGRFITAEGVDTNDLTSNCKLPSA